MGKRAREVVCACLVGLSACAVPVDHGARTVEAPSAARRPGSMRLDAPGSTAPRWRETRAGPAVDWTVSAGGGVVSLGTTAAEVSLRSGARWARLTAGDGRAWTLGPLEARDATGAVVEVAFAQEAGALVVEVGRGSGPIVVDPVLRTAPFSASFAADAVAGVGDLNGDGFDDVAAGAVGGTTSTPGQVQVWLGAPAGPDPASPLLAAPASAGWQYGRSLGGEGDLDGDGYDDLVVGGDHRVWVQYGGVSGLSSRVDRIVDPSGGTGEFGFAVRIAADVTGDGLEDLLVGNPGWDASRGWVGVYAGGSTGVSSAADQTLEGRSAGEWFGVVVAGAGDVNGDGNGDIVVGAHAWNGITGRTYLFSGTGSGLAEEPATTLAGIDPLDNFGRAAAGAGDVDQDGYADVVIGSFNGASGYGQVSVYHGAASGLLTVPTTVVRGPAYGAKFGNSVADLGDVDGDGYPDVGMGGHGTTTRAGVHHGAVAGVSTVAIPALTGGVTLGKFLDGAGDVDGDGYADLLLADPGAGTVDVHFGGPDLDGDGWISPEDCDDGDSGIRGGREVWTDADGDGFGDPMTAVVTCSPAPDQVTVAGDCDDTDAAVHPDAMEWPGDRIDSDCDGWERCFVDRDGDGALADDAEVVSVSTEDGGLDCTEHGLLGDDARTGDCDDADPEVGPDMPEVCSGTDSDCDGEIDSPVPDSAPGWWADRDGDGFGAGATVWACEAPDGMVTAEGRLDCDDADPTVHPGADDPAGDGVDSDCDGMDPAAGGGAADSDGSRSEEEAPPKGSAGCAAAAVKLHLWMWALLGLVGRRSARS